MQEEMNVRLQCRKCGPLLVPAAELRCGLEPVGERGICELRCPICHRIILIPAIASVVEALFRGGASHITGAVPFELLERHTGPALSWDELLDFKLALGSTPWPQCEVEV
jgi:hypothetical protein